MSKGSGRSIPGIDLGRAVLAARDAGLLINGGGHAMAAGFTVGDESLGPFRDFLQEQIRIQQGAAPILPRLSLDGALAVSAITVNLVDELSCVAPFGAGNEEPRFAVVDAQIVKADIVGSGHVRCILSGRSGGRVKAIAFNTADSELGVALLRGSGSRVHLAGTVRADTWQGTTSAQFVIDDAAPVGAVS
jgi:single-stranded-DNA-specific exonuclease